MTDQEREDYAIWLLRLTGCVVQQGDGSWFVSRPLSNVSLRIEILAAFVALAQARSAHIVSAGCSVTPSA